MKPLSIKLDDKLRDDFDALCKSEEKTQVAMFASLLESYSSKPANAPEIEALQGKLADLQAELQASKDAYSELDHLAGEVHEELAISKKANAELQVSIREKQASIDDLTAQIGQAANTADLTSDVKELGRIGVLETAIHNYGKSRVRAKFGNTDLLSKEKAVEGFVNTFKD